MNIRLSSNASLGLQRLFINNISNVIVNPFNAVIKRLGFFATKSPLSIQLAKMNAETMQAPSMGVTLREKINTVLGSLLDGVWNIKRTFQPSLIKMKRKHGFLARKRSRHGMKILNQRLHKGRKRLCA